MITVSRWGTQAEINEQLNRGVLANTQSAMICQTSIDTLMDRIAELDKRIQQLESKQPGSTVIV